MPVPSKVLDAVFSALSHPTRRQILVILHARGGVMKAGEIADRFKHAWPTITRHLGVLESAELLAVRQLGRERIYALQPDRAAHVAEWLLAWSAVSGENVTPEERPDWTNLEYATMRNASGPKKSSGKRSKQRKKTTKKKSK